MVFDGSIPIPMPRTLGTEKHGSARAVDDDLLSATVQHAGSFTNSESANHTIFEGTSEIQQLVIARAISALRIE